MILVGLFHALLTLICMWLSCGNLLLLIGSVLVTLVTLNPYGLFSLVLVTISIVGFLV